MQVYNEGVTSGIYPPIPELDSAFADLQSRKYSFVNAAVSGNANVDLGDDLAAEEVAFTTHTASPTTSSASTAPLKRH